MLLTGIHLDVNRYMFALQMKHAILYVKVGCSIHNASGARRGLQSSLFLYKLVTETVSKFPSQDPGISRDIHHFPGNL